MRYYSKSFHSIHFDIQFDKAGYQQFLREQRLSEHQIKYLNIHLINDFTLSHFKGNDALTASGAFFKRGREYIEKHSKTTPAFYRPMNPDNAYAAIFLRPEKCHMSTDLINRTFLHETRHHIQHCQNLLCCRSSPGNEVFASLEWKDQPWEIDAEQFADKYFCSHTFLRMVPHRLQRSDLQWMMPHKL
jgi:hypothetical protein